LSAAVYLATVVKLLEGLQAGQLHKIEQAGEVVAEAIKKDAIIHVFGSGHSHMVAEEGLYRAGGLAAVNAILESGLMLHEGAVASIRRERLPGYWELVASNHALRAGDVLIVASNSGINVASVEVASVAKGLGLTLIAITSLAYSQALQSARSEVTTSLADLADITIDNGGAYGDAAVHLDGDLRAGPTSTVLGAAIFNALIVHAAHLLVDAGIEPPLYRSSPTLGSSENNAELAKRYRGRIRHL